MSSPVSAQASKVWQLLTASSTVSSYQQAFGVTKEIIQETAQLLWLLFCLILVAGDWFWKKSIAAGQSTRTWVNDLIEPKERSATPTQTATEMWEGLVTSSKTMANSLLVKAKQQLDVPIDESASAPTPAKPAAPTPVEAPKPSKPDSGV